MNDLEIRPNIVNRITIVASIFFITTLVTIGFFIVPKLYQVNLELPNEPTIVHVAISLAAVIFSMFLFFITSIVYTMGKKIEIRGKLIYFKRKTLSGFGKWTIDKLIDISRVNTISDRKKKQVVSTGKSVIPITIYWLVFEFKDGTKQDLLLSGWDSSAIKNLFFYIKGKFPEIKFNNIIMTDSSEKLSGIDEFLKNN